MKDGEAREHMDGEKSVNRSCKRWLFAVLAAGGLSTTHVGAQPDDGPYRIDRSVIAGGGGSLGGGTFQLHGTLGQSASGTLSTSVYGFHGGFWARVGGDAPADRIFTNGFDP
jgi:hypothetical protein